MAHYDAVVMWTGMCNFLQSFGGGVMDPFPHYREEIIGMRTS